MDTLLELQRRLMQALGILGLEEAERGAPPTRAQLLEAAIGMTVEASEVLDAMNKQHRLWTPNGDVEAEVIEESIDVLFYTLEIFVLLGLTGEQIEALYRDKYKRNLGRFLSSINVEDYDEEDEMFARIQMAHHEILKETLCSDNVHSVSDVRDTDTSPRPSSGLAIQLRLF